MSAPTLAPAVDVDQLGALDFAPALPCERAEHPRDHADEPAAWAVLVACPACGDMSRYVVCDSGKNILERSAPGGSVVYCGACEHHDTWPAFVIWLDRFRP